MTVSIEESVRIAASACPVCRLPFYMHVDIDSLTACMDEGARRNDARRMAADLPRCKLCLNAPATKAYGKTGQPGIDVCERCWRLECTDPTGVEQ